MPQPHYQIRAERGQLARVTVEHGVANPELLKQLQHDLLDQLPGFAPKDPADFHLTLFHFGLPGILYEDLSRLNPKLDFKLFLSYFYDLLRVTDDAVPYGFEMAVQSLGKFGNPQSPTVALQLKEPIKLRAERVKVASAFDDFLRRCDADPGLFKRTSANFEYQHSKPFRAHISLGRLDRDRPLPDLRVAELVVQLLPSRLRNVVVDA